VMCALDRDPNERFQTAEEMRVALEKWIFASGGTSVHDLSRLMKSWFPSDHVQWQRAARLALDMQESDPPIEVAFPNLAAGKSSHSRTGTSRPDGAGSGPNSRVDWSSRLVNSGAPTPPPIGLPELRPKPWRRLAIPLVLAAAVAAGLFLYRSLSLSKPADVTVTEPKPAAGPVRPTVETLPAAAAAQPATASEAAPKVDNQAEATRPHEHEPSATEESAPRRRHPYSAERRVLLREREEYPAPTGRRTSSYEDKNTTRKTKEFRPNPF
jgi:hypothetical protein